MSGYFNTKNGASHVLCRGTRHARDIASWIAESICLTYPHRTFVFPSLSFWLPRVQKLDRSRLEGRLFPRRKNEAYNFDDIQSTGYNVMGEAFLLKAESLPFVNVTTPSNAVTGLVIGTSSIGNQEVDQRMCRCESSWLILEE